MTAKSVAKAFITFILSLGACLLAGYMGWYPALPGMPAWYGSLIKPVFAPPAWIFSTIWIASFVVMGLVLFMILNSGLKQRDVTFGLILFIGQVLFMLAWAWAFFGNHLVFVSFLLMIALVATLLSAVIQIFRFSVYGGMLMVPYLLWVLYLAYLNYGIMTLNNVGFGF